MAQVAETMGEIINAGEREKRQSLVDLRAALIKEAECHKGLSQAKRSQAKALDVWIDGFCLTSARTPR